MEKEADGGEVAESYREKERGRGGRSKEGNNGKGGKAGRGEQSGKILGSPRARGETCEGARESSGRRWG